MLSTPASNFCINKKTATANRITSKLHSRKQNCQVKEKQKETLLRKGTKCGVSKSIFFMTLPQFFKIVALYCVIYK